MEKREIKFRALVRDDGEDGGEWFWRYFEFPMELEDEFYITQYPDWESFSQYTGLKDKNGVEIYEGDVLNNPYDRSDYDIRWNDEQGAYELGENGAMLKSYQLGKFWEVIGNIYENPDLILSNKQE